MERLNYIARAPGRFAVTGAPDGYDAYLAAEAAERSKGLVLFVASDDMGAQSAIEAARFFMPGVPVLAFPAWDCLPYDRMSPKPDIESRRLATLAALARRRKDAGGALVVTTVNALLQRVPPREAISGDAFFARVGSDVDHDIADGVSRAPGLCAGQHRQGAGRFRVARRDRGSVAAGKRRSAAARFLRCVAGGHSALRCGDAAFDRPDRGNRIAARHRGAARQGFHQPVSCGLCCVVRSGDARRSALRSGERGPQASGHGALAAAVPCPPRNSVRLCAGRAAVSFAPHGRGEGRAVRADRGLLRNAPAIPRREA